MIVNRIFIAPVLSCRNLRHHGTIFSMFNIAFLRQGFLVQREVVDALRRIQDVAVVVIDVADFPTTQQAEQVCQILAEKKCALIFTINDWGMDFDGVLNHYIGKNTMVHINWCVDDPFFMELFHNRPVVQNHNRIDFVSNRAYVKSLQARGVNAHFLPLATDPALFYPLHDGSIPYQRDVGFVGNSYRKQLDELCAGNGPFLDSLVDFMASLLKRYETDCRLDLEAEVKNELASIRLPLSLPRGKAVFLVKHFLSYLFRKKIVCSCAVTYPDFTVSGDEAWMLDLPREKVSTAVGYYINLNQTYGDTKINIDINRAVISEGLTQRVFDCSAGGNFVITNNKPVLSELFVTEGQSREAIVFNSENHLKDQIDYFLRHDDERHAIAKKARERVLHEHTYDHRIATIFRIISEQMGKRYY
jgi:spore maturation protein CgeB